jgi:hypothetical protein
VVHDIEHFRAKLALESVVNWKVAMDGEIPLGSRKTPKGISPQISLTQKESSVGVYGRIHER